MPFVDLQPAAERMSDLVRTTPDVRAGRRLDELVQAWREPAALQGMTNAGGIELPAEVAATVALEELVVHGWDLASATDRTYTIEDTALHAVIGFVSQFAGPDQGDLRGEAFRDPRTGEDDASLLDRATALTGRDPAWR